ncbi:MAG: hypothetical protein V3V60_07880 [Sphingomonas aquatilis]|jgi:hypothetical protein|uniref:hypothetical protein n=1 Tax=Sphingomonas aquatilis TaxID=93063 RepID=UPI002F2F3FBE
MSVPPADWNEEVAKFLIEMNTAFEDLSDPGDHRRAASVVVIGMMERLDRLPSTKGLGGLPVVRGMIDFLQDLHHGRDHPWRSLGPFGGAQQQTQFERRFHAGALIAIEMLVDAYGGKRGSKTKAYEFVSEEMKTCERPMSVSSLRGLHWKYGLGEVPCALEVNMVLDEQWRAGPNAASPIRCPHGDPIHHCSETEGERCFDIIPATEFYVRGIFSEELFLQTA